MSGDPVAEGRRRAWGWLAHLRDGGTTPWAEWSTPGAGTGAAWPGAQQLEVVRRLNLAGRPSAALVERVLAASASGRGSPDLPLAGAAPDSRFGPRPVDPSRLPAAELLRVVTALVAEQLAAQQLEGARREEVATGRGRLRAGQRVVGDPWVAGAWRRELAQHHRTPRRRAPVLVVGAPLGQLLADIWLDRCFADGAPRWPAWLAGLEQHRRLPPRADLARIAEAWSARAGAGRVTVALDPAAVARQAGVSLPPARPSADAAELARRVGRVLGLMVPPPERARLLGEVLRPRLADAGHQPLGVPPERAAWVDRRARRLADTLSRGDYAVVGDPGEILPTVTQGVAPSVRGALDLGLGVLLDPAAYQPGEGSG